MTNNRTPSCRLSLPEQKGCSFVFCQGLFRGLLLALLATLLLVFSGSAGFAAAHHQGKKVTKQVSKQSSAKSKKASGKASKAKSSGGKKTKAKKSRVIAAPYSPRNASILIEANSGMVLEQDNADWTLYPASLTKLMTLLLTFDALDAGKITLRSPVVVSAHAASMPPSRLAVQPGNSITVDQAIRAVVTKSANDIAVALAEKVGGNESSFAQRMNLKAREIGMSHTHFVNASGLHNVQQYSSARDMAKLGQYIYKNKNRYYPYFSLRQFYYAGRISENHNHLMEEYEGMDGMKTGYVTASGFNLVASAKRNNVRLIGVVFGGKTASSRNAQMRELLDKGFEQMRRGGPILRPTTQRAQTVAPATMLTTPPSDNDTAEEEDAVPAAMTTIVATPRVAAAESAPESAGPAVAPNPADWAVQLGTYQDRVSTDQAIYRALQKLPPPLNHGNAVVMPLRTAEATWLFRARIGGYSKEQAEKACRLLEHCLVISPMAH